MVVVAAQPPAAPRATVRLAFTGDINLGTLTVPSGLPPDSGRGLLASAAPALAGHDAVIGNFEGVLGDSGTTSKCGPPRQVPAPPVVRGRARAARPARAQRPTRAAPRPRASCFVFLTPTFLAPRLAEAGFTHLNLANNHAEDFGSDARDSTAARLRAAGLVPYGPHGLIAIDTVRHGDSVAVLGVAGFSTYPFAPSLLDSAAVRTLLDSLRPTVDLLVVTFHGGAEGEKAQHVPRTAERLGREPRGRLRAFAHAAIEAGADLVVGHGPHVLRGMEFHRGRLIAYSLGNFVTHAGFHLGGAASRTGVLQVTLGEEGFRTARLVPMLQQRGRGLQPDTTGAVLRAVRTLSTADFGMHAAQIAHDGTITPPEPAR